MTERPEPGTRLQFRWRKWDGAAHWVHESIYLGRDEWGDWLGQRDGWRSARPGLRTQSRGDSVTLMPAASGAGGEYAATFNETHPRIRIYIDVAWAVGWEDGADGPAPVGIDMDLDVVEALDGRGIWIDDRDEWEEHRVRYGYPAEIVERLEHVALDLEARVRARTAPFDTATPARWLAVLRDLNAPG